MFTNSCPIGAIRDGSSGTITMGNRSPSTSEWDVYPYFTGAFDDVRIFNKALSANDIISYGIISSTVIHITSTFFSILTN